MQNAVGFDLWALTPSAFTLTRSLIRSLFPSLCLSNLAIVPCKRPLLPMFCHTNCLLSIFFPGTTGTSLGQLDESFALHCLSPLSIDRKLRLTRLFRLMIAHVYDTVYFALFSRENRRRFANRCSALDSLFCCLTAISSLVFQCFSSMGEYFCRLCNFLSLVSTEFHGNLHSRGLHFLFARS